MNLDRAVKRDMEREFKVGVFKGMVRDYTLSRQATDGVLDPVTEEYTGGTNGISDMPIRGIMRSIKRKIAEKYDLTLDHSQLTALQSELTIKPKQNDEIDTSSVDGDPVRMRVVEVDQDPALVFYHLILKRAS